MKKILAVITCLLMILSLIACNNNSTISETDSSNGEDSKEDHVHSYTVENVTPELIAAEANCESAVSYFYSCSCGDVGDKTFTVDDTLGLHKTENGECIVCKLPESSAGLSYKLNSDGTSYTVTGLGTCTDSDIVIGSYNNMSVTGIYTGAFHSKQGITSVTICDTVTSIGSMAFSSTSIKSVSIGKGVRNIGYGAFALFVIQMADAKYLHPNDGTDPAFGKALRQAAAAGVTVLAMDCAVTPDTMTRVGFVISRT